MNLHFSYIGDSQRLDKILGQLPLQLSRSQIQKCCLSLKVNKKDSKHSTKIFYKDEIEVEVINLHSNKKTNEDSTNNAELQKMIRSIKDSILYEDDHLCVINKRRGDVVHPGAGVRDITIAEAVFDMLISYESSLESRAGIVHRLDKDTTGVLLIAKTAQAHNFYASQFAERKIKKVYLSIVKGIPQHPQGEVRSYLARNKKNRKKFVNLSCDEFDHNSCDEVSLNQSEGQSQGKLAISKYKVLWSSTGKQTYSIVLWDIKTGRTHQIRLHAQHLGTPVLGDSLYARSISDENLKHCNLMLHAFYLQCKMYNPNTTAAHTKREFFAPIPSDISKVCEQLGVSIESILALINTNELVV